MPNERSSSGYSRGSPCEMTKWSTRAKESYNPIVEAVFKPLSTRRDSLATTGVLPWWPNSSVGC
jgi:hypothetical protein